jgi:hypothetical protein
MTTGRAVVPNIFGNGSGIGVAGMDPDSHAPGAANPGAPNFQVRQGRKSNADIKKRFVFEGKRRSHLDHPRRSCREKTVENKRGLHASLELHSMRAPRLGIERQLPETGHHAKGKKLARPNAYKNDF